MFFKLIPMLSLFAVSCAKPSTPFQRGNPPSPVLLQKSVLLAVAVSQVGSEVVVSRVSQQKLRGVYDEPTEAYSTSKPRDLQRFPISDQNRQQDVESSSQFSGFVNRQNGNDNNDQKVLWSASNTQKTTQYTRRTTQSPQWTTQSAQFTSLRPQSSQSSYSNDNRNPQSSQNSYSNNKQNPPSSQSSYADNDFRTPDLSKNSENSDNRYPESSQSSNNNYGNPTLSQESSINRVPQNPQFNQNFVPSNVNREEKKPDEQISYQPPIRKQELIHTYDSNPVYTPNQKVAIDIEYPTENYSANVEYTTRKPLRRPQIVKKSNQESQ